MGEELCAPAGLQCRVVNGHVQITVIPDPRCPCENFVVMRDNRVGIPLLRPPAFFQDPEPCEGRHTYVAACRSKEGTSGVDPTPDALGCESYTCR